jgi:gonadotropin-releasing hormone receptor
MTLILPLVVMLGSYITIIILIYRRSQQSQVSGGTISSQGVIGKARFQTIKVTGVLVLGFILCWTPYYTMTFW